MNVSLTPHLEAMVREKVESGRYSNASEVVREALRLMEAQDIRQGLANIASTRDVPADEGRPPRSSGAAILEWIARNPIPKDARRSPEEIDRAIQEERDAWE